MKEYLDISTKMYTSEKLSDRTGDSGKKSNDTKERSDAEHSQPAKEDRNVETDEK